LFSNTSKRGKNNEKVALLWAVVLLGMVAVARADIVGAGPAPVILPAATQDVYFHIGALNLNVPWDNVNVVYLYDLEGKRNLVGGEAVVASIWRLQATVGGVTSLDGQGAPFVGGNLWFTNPIPAIAILSEIKPGIFGGWDWTRGNAIFGFKAALPLF
jgi:hypothetical protein